MSATTASPILTTSTALPPYGDPPAAAGHSFFWYFFVISIETLVLAGLVVVTHLTVTKGSGLNDPEKVRRIWARAPEIRFQPVMRPMVFAVAVGYGAQTVVHALISGVLSFFGLGFDHHTLNAIVGLLSCCVASWLSVVIYRATGGTLVGLCGVSMIAVDWFMAGILLNLAFSLYSKLGLSPFVGFVTFALVHLLVQGAFQTPFLVWGQHTKLPATARLIYNSSVVPGWVKLDRTILVAAGPLAFIYFVAYICEFRLNTNSYFSNIVQTLATFMILAASALTSIISVNRALLANEFQWQWRAFLTPAIPLGAMRLVVTFIKLVTGQIGFCHGVWSVIHFTLSSGSCGVLGAYVYMMLAERYAKAHFDEDELAQDDILAEFEEDEDNEELEV